MTTRTTTPMPLTPETRQHLIEHRDELHSLATSIDQTHADLRTDAKHLGMPIDPDALRIVREASDLLMLAARRINPDQESTR